MPQAQQKKHPGFGIVYPGGGQTGIRVTNTFTDAPRKIVQPDGSITHTIPSPTIHELFGGGFTYADGKLVTNREHLEAITAKNMRERALAWYDAHGKVITPIKDVVERGEQPERPEPDYILSTQLPKEEDEVTQGLNAQMQNSLDSILKSIQALAGVVQQQGKDIVELKKGPPPPKVTIARKAQSDAMKARWSNPEFKKRMIEKRRGKGEANETDRHEVTEKVEGDTGNGSPETGA